MSRLVPGSAPLVVALHALDLEMATVRAAGWRIVRCRPEELVAPSVPTLAWVRTGMGIEPARRTVDAIPDLPIAAALCTGFAGALAPDLLPRMLVIADPLLDAGGRTHATPLSGSLAEAAVVAGLDCRCAALVTVPHVVDSPAEKARLFDALGAVAVDMESATLVAAFAERGVSAAAVRVVLDTAAEEIPASLGAIWRRPGLLAPSLRIAARMRPCARISARLLEAWLAGRLPGSQREPDGGDDREAEQTHER